MKATVRLIERGQIVIPEQVRAALKLQKGDLLEIDVIKFQSSNIGDDAGNHKPAPPKIKNR
ncbi:MAG: AbrB/MazE/SpoVT family DNA-binding domain-containing protein [Candidatus Methanoperedens sp.]|nr:AbrB/MazE/SpoVT family DNA-binding domain-containing protein [Candidatus Methanoperedens sp.]